MIDHVRYHIKDQLIRIEQEEETKNEYFLIKKFVFFTFGSDICLMVLINCLRLSK
jgi:hypothetical protein